MPFDFLKKQKPTNSQNPMSTTSSTGRYPGDILIGDLMVKAGVISSVQLDEAVKLAGNKHLQLGQMLIMAGHISPRDLQAAVDAQSMLRDRAMDQNMATRCLKIACKTGMNFVDVFRDQDGAKTTGAVSNKLGELLLEANLIDREQFGKSMQRSLATGLPLGRILVLNGALSETVLNTALEIQVRVRDGMLNREEALEALRGLVGDSDPEEAQRQTLTLQTVLSNPPRKKGIRLGELMVLAGLLNETDVMNALEQGLVNEQPIGEVMVNQGYLTNEMLNYALELQKKVDGGDLQATEAGQVLAKISANGIPLEEAIAEFIAPPELAYETLTFDRMLVLSRVITDEQIDESFNRAIASPQILAKLLVLTEHISNPAMQAVLQCYSMMSNNFLSQDDAIIALDYCLNESAERNITFGEALQELGWSATQSIQMQAQNSVAVTHIKLQAMMHPDGSLAAPEEKVDADSFDDSVAPSGSGENNGYTDAMAEQEAANEEAWLPEESEVSTENSGDESTEDDAENFKVSSGNLPPDLDVEDEQPVESDSSTYAESAEMQEAQEIIDPAENYEESEVVNADDDADFSEVFEVQDSEEKESLADSIDQEFSNDDEIASSASVPSEEHVAVVPGVDDAAENEAFRKEFSLDSEDIVKETELALPAEPPSLAELMGQAKELEDKMAAESEHTMDEAKSKFEKEVQKDEALRAEKITADAASSAGSLKDLFKPDAASDDSKSGGNGHTPVIQPLPANAPSPLAAVASTSTSVAAEASNVQAPKALGDLFKANTSPAETPEVAAPSENRPSAIQALLGSDSSAAKPVTASSLPSANSLHAMLTKGAGASSSSLSSSAGTSSTTNSPVLPSPAPVAPSGGLSGLLSGMAPPAPTATTSSSALQALTPVPVTPAAVPVVETKTEPPAESKAEPVASVPEKAKAKEEPAAQATSVKEPTPPAPEPIKPVEALEPAKPALVETPAPLPPAVAPTSEAMPQAIPAPAPAVAPAPAPATPQSALASTPEATAPPAPTVVQSTPAPPPVAADTVPVAPAPLTATVQPAQEQPVPAAGTAQQAFDESANRLAESYFEQGNYAEAQKLYERILAAKEQQLGATHHTLGADLTNLAAVMCVQGLFQQAEPNVRRLVLLVEQAEPLDLLKLAESLNMLAGILFQQGKFADCEPLLGRALKLRQQKLGSEHPDIADNLRDYAKLLRKLGREEEAEFMYAQAKAILSKRPKADDK